MLFVCDDVSGFNIHKDTTYALMKAAAKAGHEIFVCDTNALFAKGPVAFGLVRQLTLQEGHAWYLLSDPETKALSDFDVIFMRKDPPFNMNFIYATYLLELAQNQGVKVVNNPKSLRDANEKCFILQFPEAITPTMVAACRKQHREFITKHKDVILKPLDGMGGASIFRIKENDANLSVVLDVMTDFGQTPIMAQTYLPEIKQGDKRILLINGEPVSHCLARLPAEGETRANIAAGGHGEVRELTARDRELAAIVGPRLKEMGLFFVGLDVIGNYVTEINVTSPTCLQEIARETGEDIAGSMIAQL